MTNKLRSVRDGVRLDLTFKLAVKQVRQPTAARGTILPPPHHPLTNITQIFSTYRLHISSPTMQQSPFVTYLPAPAPTPPHRHRRRRPPRPPPSSLWLPSGLLGCSFGFPIGSCFDLGHLHICQGVRREAGAHAFDGPLVSRPLLLQRADRVLHFALPRKEVLHARLQSLNLLPCSLKDTDTSVKGRHSNTGTV